MVNYLSRRGFLSYTVSVPAASLIGNALRGVSPAAPENRERSFQTSRAVLLGFCCVLVESLHGYRAGLRLSGVSFEESCRPIADAAELIVVPAAGLTELEQARRLRTQIEHGATALVEAGGAFLGAEEFSVHQRLLRSEFGLAALAPVNLWDSGARSNGPPYVDFTWPVKARIRDFSYLVPLEPAHSQTVAVQAGTTVAVKRRLGAGTLIFLGSPVGPHLLAGDREAKEWFEGLLRHV
jgi:hypothetical protein